ncbi:hypothetical protein AMTR_s00098p00167030 [Amborella trichopoda]|uniref:Uncharacterized protein n=1 Tax=Amborella trichopoda TaxID=13333 RepID=W1NWZ7_AMBTC|nr:hypothetical protein AMTR_s00098p00167030 [Amborella trichopoda]
MKILRIPPSLPPIPALARNAAGMKILCILTSHPLLSAPTHNVVGTKILRIPTSLPKVKMAPTARKEPVIGLKVLKIPASLRKQCDPPTLRVNNPPNHLKVRCCTSNRAKVTNADSQRCTRRKQARSYRSPKSHPSPLQKGRGTRPNLQYSPTTCSTAGVYRAYRLPCQGFGLATRKRRVVQPPPTDPRCLLGKTRDP